MHSTDVGILSTKGTVLTSCMVLLLPASKIQEQVKLSYQFDTDNWWPEGQGGRLSHLPTVLLRNVRY
eukprot:3728147-Rhodomonas_salina.4